MIRNAWHIGGGEGDFENSTNLRVLCLYKDKKEEVVVVQNDMGLGDPNAKDYKDKVMKQLKREKAGEKNGGLIDIDITGESKICSLNHHQLKIKANEETNNDLSGFQRAAMQ